MELLLHDGLLIDEPTAKRKGEKGRGRAKKTSCRRRRDRESEKATLANHATPRGLREPCVRGDPASAFALFDGGFGPRAAAPRLGGRDEAHRLRARQLPGPAAQVLHVVPFGFELFGLFGPRRVEWVAAPQRGGVPARQLELPGGRDADRGARDGGAVGVYLPGGPRPERLGPQRRGVRDPRLARATRRGHCAPTPQTTGFRKGVALGPQHGRGERHDVRAEPFVRGRAAGAAGARLALRLVPHARGRPDQEGGHQGAEDRHQDSPLHGAQLGEKAHRRRHLQDRAPQRLPRLRNARPLHHGGP
mmetsp:Transcript_59250/g.134149  ORF Transcript_59250/g.134149 Transcript_59250/m.134149 type:complete len:304 (+) Transcript_59250:349-1260(+)